MTILEADFMKIDENCTKMTILEAVFEKKISLSDSNPDFGYYGVEIFNRFEFGFE